MSPIPFSRVSALVPFVAGHFTAELSPDWTIGGKPNGGYLLAILGRAAVAVGSHDQVIAASSHYLHSPVPGPVDVEVEVLRAGRSASQLRARMMQDGKPCVDATFTTSTLAAGGTAYWDRGVPAPSEVGRDDCVRIPGQTPTGTPVPINDQVDLRIEPLTLSFAAGRPSGGGELRGWLSLPGDEPFDSLSLLYAADAFPPATFEIELTGWVPTLQLNVYVRALPAPGPVQILQRAQLIDGQFVDELCYVWDSTGRLVAQASQLAGIRLG